MDNNMETVQFLIRLIQDNPAQGITVLVLIAVGVWRFVLMTFSIITKSQTTADTAVKGIISGEERGDGLILQLIQLKASDSRALERIAESGEKAAAADERMSKLMEHHDASLSRIGETVSRVDITSLATKTQVDDILQRIIRIEELLTQEQTVTRRIGTYVADTRKRIINLQQPLPTVTPVTPATDETEADDDAA